jgi:membrane protein YdbS with pleckstrin-like domain
MNKMFNLIPNWALIIVGAIFAIWVIYVIIEGVVFNALVRYEKFKYLSEKADRELRESYIKHGLTPP